MVVFIDRIAQIGGQAQPPQRSSRVKEKNKALLKKWHQKEIEEKKGKDHCALSFRPLRSNY